MFFMNSVKHDPASASAVYTRMCCRALPDALKSMRPGATSSCQWNCVDYLIEKPLKRS